MPELRLPPAVLFGVAFLLLVAVGTLIVWLIRIRSSFRDFRKKIERRLNRLEDRLSRQRADPERRTAGRSASPADDGSGMRGQGESRPSARLGESGSSERVPEEVEGAESSGSEESNASTDPSRQVGSADGTPGEVDLSDAGYGSDASGSGASAGESGLPGHGYSRESVHELYARWCERGREPHPPSDMEIQSMRHAGSVREDELSEARHRLEDATGTSDFVRFSPAHGEKGLLLPHPDVRFNPSTHGKFFPDADRSLFEDPANLTRLEPVAIQRRDDGRWEATNG